MYIWKTFLPVESCRPVFTLHSCGVKVAEDVKCHDKNKTVLETKFSAYHKVARLGVRRTAKYRCSSTIVKGP